MDTKGRVLLFSWADFISCLLNLDKSRTVEEFKKGHLESALNVPYMFMTPEGRVKNPQFLEQVSLICNKEDHLVVGCHSGVRSLHASADLLNAGFKHIKNMGGGYAAWLENGFGVKKPEAEL